MNILVLIPKKEHIAYSFFTEEQSAGCFKIKVIYQDICFDFKRLAKKLIDDCLVFNNTPDVIAIRSPFSTPDMENPFVVTKQSLEKLADIAIFSPIHLPIIIELIQSFFNNLYRPKIMIFAENAFCFNLPERESFYALDMNIKENSNFKRYCYKGLFHSAACNFAIHKARMENQKSDTKIISICLESHPEVVASRDKRPIMVSSGATPLEGIMGHTVAGQIDPSIIVTLSNKMKWGPEKINQMLTHESGIKGITGKELSIEDIFNDSDDKSIILAKNIIEYQLIKTFGAAIACMGGGTELSFQGDMP